MYDCASRQKRSSPATQLLCPGTVSADARWNSQLRQLTLLLGHPYKPEKKCKNRRWRLQILDPVTKILLCQPQCARRTPWAFGNLRCGSWGWLATLNPFSQNPFLRVGVRGGCTYMTGLWSKPKPDGARGRPWDSRANPAPTTLVLVDTKTRVWWLGVKLGLAFVSSGRSNRVLAVDRHRFTNSSNGPPPQPERQFRRGRGQRRRHKKTLCHGSSLEAGHENGCLLP
jgi:hypothetical protein